MNKPNLFREFSESNHKLSPTHKKPYDRKGVKYYDDLKDQVYNLKMMTITKFDHSIRSLGKSSVVRPT